MADQRRGVAAAEHQRGDSAVQEFRDSLRGGTVPANAEHHRAFSQSAAEGLGSGGLRRGHGGGTMAYQALFLFEGDGVVGAQTEKGGRPEARATVRGGVAEASRQGRGQPGGSGPQDTFPVDKPGDDGVQVGIANGSRGRRFRGSRPRARAERSPLRRCADSPAPPPGPSLGRRA